jgi:hypothetical protein
VSRLVALAARGLVPMFDPQKQLFCYKLRKVDHGLVREGLSPRYTMMTLMGLHRLRQAGGVSPIEIEPVLQRLLADLKWVDNIGDLGVLLWLCGIVSPESFSEVQRQVEIKSALERYPDAKRGLTMELAWFLTGLSYWGLTREEKLEELRDLAFKTYGLLKRNQGKGGFFGHLDPRSGIRGIVRGRIGSFADQVYPIYAFTRFSKAFGEQEPLERAMDCARAICAAQGSQGQWWWHYDSMKGRVLEGYPVFSVHQHAMAPMTLFALGDTIQHDFRPWIYRGLEWINSQNELGIDMEESSSDLVWRCIVRSRTSLGRYLKSLGGSYSDAIQHDRPEDLKILFECRPYELGWLLYAFVLRSDKPWIT